MYLLNCSVLPVCNQTHGHASQKFGLRLVATPSKNLASEITIGKIALMKGWRGRELREGGNFRGQLESLALDTLLPACLAGSVAILMRGKTDSCLMSFLLLCGEQSEKNEGRENKMWRLARKLLNSSKERLVALMNCVAVAAMDRNGDINLPSGYKQLF